MCIFASHPGEYLNCASGWILTGFHVCFYSPSSWISNCASLHFLLAYMCTYTAHPGKYLTVHSCISYCSLCCLQPIQVNILIAHLGEFLTVHPCVLLQPILVNILLFNANQDNFLMAQCAHPGEHLAARSDDYLAVRTGNISLHISWMSWCASRWVILQLPIGEYLAAHPGECILLHIQGNILLHVFILRSFQLCYTNNTNLLYCKKKWAMPYSKFG